MTAEREAMTLEKWRELRGHVAGMQCAIDNCGINKDEWNEAAKYAMDNMGEWKRLLSEYAALLSRAAEPVAIIRDLEDTAAFGGMGSPCFHQDEWERLRDLPAGTEIFAHPPESARDARVTDARVREACAAFSRSFNDKTFPECMRLALDAAMAQEPGE